MISTAANTQPGLAQLLSRLPEQQKSQGYYHTLGEILQQPLRWLETCSLMIESAPRLNRVLEGVQNIVLTGSGSSQHAGECVRLALQKELKTTVEAIGGGTLLTYLGSALPSGRPGLVVSLARSGDSPESGGALAALLASEPGIRHLILTCNPQGSLAGAGQSDSRVNVVVLDDRTNDRSLVMTSSFTNLALAARFLGLRYKPETYRSICEQQSRICTALFANHFDALTRSATKGCERVVFLGSGPRWGAACESALKMLEMTGGRVATMSETFLGLRHGPMSFIDGNTLTVCFVSSERFVKAYEVDLISELNRKQLGFAKVIIGEEIPQNIIQDGDLVVELAGLSNLGDENSALLNVVAGQLLAFGRCREEGLSPDSPSHAGIINRVVEGFTVYPAPATAS
jgi:tagatose-6-phosphate ketose/aldose isomerase